MKRLLVLIAIIALLAAAIRDLRQWRLQQAERLFTRGDPSGAIAAWSAAAKLPGDNSVTSFNRGTAYCKMGRYSAALGDFTAAAAAEDQKLRQLALYNLGTAQLHSGAAAADGAAAQRHLSGAVQSLTAALSIAPTDADTLHNLAFARTRLAAILQRAAQNGNASQSATSSRQPDSTDREKRGKPEENIEGRNPGKATEADLEGAKRRSHRLDQKEALRMLDEARGKEALRSAVAAEKGNGRLSPPERDW